MAVVPSSRLARKKTTRLGRRFAAIHVGPTRVKKIVQVHADLLCARSSFFKERLQNCRKDLKDECSVCHNDFDPDEDNITHCKACDQNLHNHCIDDWLRRRTTCPLCRAVWAKEEQADKATCEELDPDGFDDYVKWLYTGNLPQLKGNPPEPDALGEHTMRLIKAWSVGQKAKDRVFRNAALKQLANVIDLHDYLPSATVMGYLYGKDSEGLDLLNLRFFVADVFVMKLEAYDSEWYVKRNEPWVVTWLNHYAPMLKSSLDDARSGGEEPTMNDIVKKYESRD